MDSNVVQGELFPLPPPKAGTVRINDRVTIQTEEGYRLVCVDNVILHHYRIGDQLAEAYATVMLFESGYADQNDIARTFGFSTRTVRRYQERFDAGGLQALGKSRGRPQGSGSMEKTDRFRDRTILRLKADGYSNRDIGSKLGLDEKTIRKKLQRLDWKPPIKQLDFLENDSPLANHQDVKESGSNVASPIETSQDDLVKKCDGSEPNDEQFQTSFDNDPLDRSLDRLFAAFGLLDDALPLFAPATNVPRAGVLLAIPALEASGLLSIAKEVYGSIVSLPLSTASGQRWSPSYSWRSLESNVRKR